MITTLTPVGIWLDYRQALIVYVNGNTERMIKVSSNIDESHPVGGSGSSIPYSTQEAVSESTYLRRRLQQEKRYYQLIRNKISDRDGIYILGPAQAKLGLKLDLERHPETQDKIQAVEPCDRLTDKQIKAKVRKFFRKSS